jgi:putative endonuclease
MTNDNIRRTWEHLKRRSANSFSARYNVCIPVYCAIYPDASSAIAAEKMIKGWTRARKIELIESMNPEWRNLSEEPIRS